MITWDKPEDTYVALHRTLGHTQAPKTLREIQLLNDAGFDIYYHINRAALPPGRLKARSADITHIRGLLIDIDPLHSPGSIPYSTGVLVHDNALDTARLVFSNPVVERWLGQEAPLSAIGSGRGVQLLLHVEPFRVDRPPLWYEQRQRLALMDLATRWLMSPYGQDTRIDVSCTDLGRLGRLPQTRNWKVTHRVARSYVQACTSRPPLTKEEYLELLSRYQPKPILNPRITSNQDFASILNLMNTTARRWVDGGAEEGDRHRMAYATAKNLLELGLDPDRTFYVVGLGNRWCTKRLPDEEIKRIVQSAHSSQRRDPCTISSSSSCSSSPSQPSNSFSGGANVPLPL